MLQVVGFSSASLETIESDEFIPITINWGSPSTGNVVYWRTGDNQRSLLEIGIDAHMSVVCSLTLVLTPSIFEKQTLDVQISSPQSFGLPICDLNRWGSSMYFDDLHSFEVSNSKNGLLIDLQSQTPVESFLIAGRTRFGINKQAGLCLIEIVALPDAVMSTLKEYHLFRS